MVTFVFPTKTLVPGRAGRCWVGYSDGQGHSSWLPCLHSEKKFLRLRKQGTGGTPAKLVAMITGKELGLP